MGCGIEAISFFVQQKRFSGKPVAKDAQRTGVHSPNKKKCPEHFSLLTNKKLINAERKQRSVVWRG